MDAPREIDETAFEEIRTTLALARGGDEEAEFEQIRTDLERIGERLRRFAERRLTPAEDAEGDS
jgi:hypothetical protein